MDIKKEILSIFFFAKQPKPFLGAIVPAIGFVLSTLSIPVFKKWWINKKNKGGF